MIIFIVVVLAALLIVGGCILDNRLSIYNDSGIVCIATGCVFVIATVVMLGVVFAVNVGSKGTVASSQERYESLKYQAENSLYENDNDFGKKELANQIQEWNEDVARGKAMQHDFWVGVFYPNIYDDLEFISVDLMT